MMSLGSSGGPSSSSSNLSASAPPFTIDRFSSNPNLSYGTPFAHTWQYSPIPSAPQPEVEPELTSKTSVPVSSGFGYVSAGQWPTTINPGSMSNSGFYVSEPGPHQPPFMSPVIPEGSSSLTISQPMYDPPPVHVSPQVDYNAQMSGVGYLPHWQGLWKGDLRHGDQVGSGGSQATEKLSESSPFSYKNYIYEDATIQSGDAFRGDTGILYGLSTDGIQMASHAGSYNAGIAEKHLFTKENNAGIYPNPVDGTEKDSCSKSFNTTNVDGRSTSLNMMNFGESLFSQNLGHLPLECPGTQFQGPNSSYPEFSSPGTFQEHSKCFSNNQQTYGIEESCIRPRGSFGKDPTTPMKRPCAMVIKAPANNTSSAAPDTDKIVGNRIASNFHSKLLDIPHLSEYCISTRPESTGGSCYPNQTENDGNYWNFFASNSKGAVPPNSRLEGSVDFILSNSSASQITDTNASYGRSPPFDYAQGYKYAEDSLENNILALDSPCWKGAQAPYSSNSDFIESLPRTQFSEEVDGCLDLPSNVVGPSRVSSQDLPILNANFRTGCAANGEIPSPLDLSLRSGNFRTGCVPNDELPSQTITSESSFAAKELNPNTVAKEVINFRNSCSSDDGQFLNDSDKLREEHKVSNMLLETEAKYSCSNQCKIDNGFVPAEVNLHSGMEDRVTNCSEAADAGAVAYHAAENVLYTPPAQEVREEHLQPSVEVATKRVDISALVNAMHSLSEVLHSHCSADSSGLTKENQVSLKRVIRNLDACVPKNIVDCTPVFEFMVPQRSSSVSTVDGGHHGKDKGAGLPHQNYEATVISDELDCQNIHDEKIKYRDEINYGNQANLPYFFQAERNKRISSDEMVAQGIKKVLDENFNFEEEMQSQVLLFKNLWLEAEARLCSISYRAHFDHMRALMDGHKLKNGKGSADYTGKIPGSKVSQRVTENGALPEEIITKRSSSGIGTIGDKVDTSLLPGLNASLHHGDGYSLDEHRQLCISRENEARSGSVVTHDAVGHVEDLKAAVFSRLNILKQRDVMLNEVEDQPDVLHTNSPGSQSGLQYRTSNTEIQTSPAATAVLALLDILKQRDDKSNEVQPPYVPTDSGRQSGSSSSTSTTEIQASLAEAAVLARLDILKQRDDKSNGVQPLYGTTNSGLQSRSSSSTSTTEIQSSFAEAAVLARLNILKQRDDKSNGVQPLYVTTNSGLQSGSSTSTSTTEIQANREAAVLAPSNILNQLDEKSNKVQPQHVTTNSGRGFGTFNPEFQGNHPEAAALARLNILKQRDIRSPDEELHNVDSRIEEGQLDSSTCGYGYRSTNDFTQFSMNNEVIQRSINRNQGIPSWPHDSFSSEWEHVQKDEISWQKG